MVQRSEVGSLSSYSNLWSINLMPITILFLVVLVFLASRPMFSVTGGWGGYIVETCNRSS